MITIEEIQKRFIEMLENEVSKAKGQSQEEFAQKIKVSQQTVSHYLRGHFMPSIETLANICKELDVSPAYIMCFDDVTLT